MQELAYPSEMNDSAVEALKIAPQSIEAEQSVLGGLMLDNQAWDKAADMVVEEDFYRRDHRLIFRAIAALQADSKPCDVVTLQEWLDKNGLLEDAGGLAYLGTLAKNTPSAANIKAYCEIVRNRSVLRQLIAVGNGISGSAYQTEGRSTEELLDDAEREVFKIAEQGARAQKGFVAIKDLLVKAVDRIDALYQNDSAYTGMPT